MHHPFSEAEKQHLRSEAVRIIEQVHSDFVAKDERLPLDQQGRPTIDFKFSDLSLRLKDGTSIMAGVTGQLTHSRLTAVMGPSGSGKSSLLNALIGRLESPKKNTYTLTGTRYLNDKPLDPTEHLNCAYVKQEDLFFAHQTVRETLMFRVNLKFDPKQVSTSVSA